MSTQPEHTLPVLTSASSVRHSQSKPLPARGTLHCQCCCAPGCMMQARSPRQQRSLFARLPSHNMAQPTGPQQRAEPAVLPQCHTHTMPISAATTADTDKILLPKRPAAPPSHTCTHTMAMARRRARTLACEAKCSLPMLAPAGSTQASAVTRQQL